MIHLTGPRTKLSSFHRPYYFLIVRNAAMRAKKVITVSRFSKSEISRVLKIPPEKIEVIYNGIDNNFFKPAENRKYDPETKPACWLFVGNEKPHKNVVNVIKAYAIAKRENRSVPPLALAGVSKKDTAGLLSLDKIEGVYFPVIRSDRELADLYRRASIFIAPSLEEGFGFPILEAMASGTPVITSDIPVLKEITGGAALTVDPHSEKAIADAMLKVHGDDVLKGKMKKSGVSRAASFTLRSTAEQTLRIYREQGNG